MTKYTINKAFEKSFPYPIWKIEVDCTKKCIAIEYRNPDNTRPTFAVFDFRGQDLLHSFIEQEKEWTLEAVQGDYMILKQFGSNTPIKEGIKIVHIPSKNIIYTGMEYILHDVFEGYIKAAHRSIPSGLDFYINIQTGEIQNRIITPLNYPLIHVHYPLPYTGKLPKFMQSLAVEDTIWLQPIRNNFIWAYHTKAHDSYNLHLCLSSRSEIFDTKIILDNLTKLIPQPYFQVEDYIFFLSNTKQEIVAYLV
ncbi:hypothetical protein FAZ15_02015 [Sphingobacterium olei]|uniref:DUF4905 domain-containing protein n=1 Tax=Sphingobacterium olei TaxID=2571155 RepID=A0A4U0P6M1_9SPHI|nr:hypothetical protein [Sphingobacterium olei]TJZ63095.1 hypothetical protein FAZ15_02015 [Sphingobacterium olei]